MLRRSAIHLNRTTLSRVRFRVFSTAVATIEDDDDHYHKILSWKDKEDSKHCSTCQCSTPKTLRGTPSTPLPPPLPAPKYSVRRRVLPSNLSALHSPDGQRFLMEALVHQTAAPYFLLTEHFSNQSDPAYCGVTSLVILLNALALDPHVRWKGGWRYYGHEDMLLSQCCLSPEHIRREGVTMEQWAQLAHCQGLRVQLERPPPTEVTTAEGSVPIDEDEGEREDLQLTQFRRHLIKSLQQQSAPSTMPLRSHHNDNGQHLPVTTSMVVVSYSRSALGQTGEGHFSPVAAYHAETDQVLILDVARFKYPPYWVRVRDLYRAMKEPDTVTGLSRGWFWVQPPKQYDGLEAEDRLPIQVVREFHEEPLCPVHTFKVEFCQASRPRNSQHIKSIVR